MSNDGNHGDSELELDLQDTSANESSMDAGERTTDDQSDVEVAEDLDLESEKDDKDDAEKAKRREAAVDTSARTWAARIITGKATETDIPPAQKYLIPRVRALLGKKEPEKVEKKEVNTSKELTVEQRIDLKVLKDSLEAADLTAEQIKTFNEEKNYLLAQGVNVLDAFRKAVKYSGIDLNAERQTQPRIKTGGGQIIPKEKFTGTEDPSKMSRKQLAEYVKHNKTVGRS